MIKRMSLCVLIISTSVCTSDNNDSDNKKIAATATIAATSGLAAHSLLNQISHKARCKQGVTLPSIGALVCGATCAYFTKETLEMFSNKQNGLPLVSDIERRKQELKNEIVQDILRNPRSNELQDVRERILIITAFGTGLTLGAPSAWALSRAYKNLRQSKGMLRVGIPATFGLFLAPFATAFLRAGASLYNERKQGITDGDLNNIYSSKTAEEAKEKFANLVASKLGITPQSEKKHDSELADEECFREDLKRLDAHLNSIKTEMQKLEHFETSSAEQQKLIDNLQRQYQAAQQDLQKTRTATEKALEKITRKKT